MDGPKVSKWTVSECQSGGSESVKVGGSKVLKWTVQEYQSGRSESVKLVGPKVLKWTVRNPYPKSTDPNCNLTLIAP